MESTYRCWTTGRFRAAISWRRLSRPAANAVRIQWYVNYPQPDRPSYGLADLDSVLAKCATNRMIPILELHDDTCEPNAELVNKT